MRLLSVKRYIEKSYVKRIHLLALSGCSTISRSSPPVSALGCPRSSLLKSICCLAGRHLSQSVTINPITPDEWVSGIHSVSKSTDRASFVKNVLNEAMSKAPQYYSLVSVLSSHRTFPNALWFLYLPKPCLMLKLAHHRCATWHKIAVHKSVADQIMGTFCTPLQPTTSLF